jgi:hypothetical protein
MSKDKEIFDVIVVGGGISGAMAAIGAARAGAKTLLVEQYGFLGGMLTAAGVGPMMSFHAGEQQVIQGATGELIDRLVEKGHSPGHIADSTGYTATVTPFDVEGMKRELELMLIEAGGEVLYHAMLASVESDGDRIQSITVSTKGGLMKLNAKVFVDATGDADVAVAAGVACSKGRPSDGACQPMTLKMRMLNVDMQKVREFIKNNPDEFPFLEGDVSRIEKAPRVSIGGFVKQVAAARAVGEFTLPRESILFFEANAEGEVIVNTTRIQGHDANDPWSFSAAEIEGRRQAEEVNRFLRNYIPGFEEAVLVYTGPQIGVRSSRQIKGCYRLKSTDVFSQISFPDTIAHTGYPVDIHNPTGSAHIEFEKPAWGTYCNIPYRCLVTEQVSNLIAVGRCISVDFEAQGAVRTTPTMGAVGHAGGIAAALAVSDSVHVNAVNTDKLQLELKAQGAFLQLDYRSGD